MIIEQVVGWVPSANWWSRGWAVVAVFAAARVSLAIAVVMAAWCRVIVAAAIPAGAAGWCPAIEVAWLIPAEVALAPALIAPDNWRKLRLPKLSKLTLEISWFEKFMG
jgi:hypothetical protein